MQGWHYSPIKSVESFLIYNLNDSSLLIKLTLQILQGWNYSSIPFPLLLARKTQSKPSKAFMHIIGIILQFNWWQVIKYFDCFRTFVGIIFEVVGINSLFNKISNFEIFLDNKDRQYMVWIFEKKKKQTEKVKLMLKNTDSEKLLGKSEHLTKKTKMTLFFF